MSNKVYAGKNPNIELAHFNSDERKIIDEFSKEFYVTSGGRSIQIGLKSKYVYILIKPTSVYGDMFNLDREIAVLFSQYDTIEPRTLEAYDIITENHPALRIEKICNVLVSMDDNAEVSLSSLLSNESESQVIVPFTYSELLSKKDDSYFFRNRFRNYFYTRDLFAFEGPLKKDLYFFGRTDLIHEVVNRTKKSRKFGAIWIKEDRQDISNKWN